MTKEQRPARAYQPWRDGEYELLERLHYAYKTPLEQLAQQLCRFPSEIENALRRLDSLKEAMTNSQKTQAQAHVNDSYRGKEIHEAIRNFPEHLIDHYGSGLRSLDAVLKPKTSVLTKADLAEIEKRFLAKYSEYFGISPLVINGKNYDTLLGKARERVHLQIEISATLAGGK